MIGKSLMLWPQATLSNPWFCNEVKFRLDQFVSRARHGPLSSMLDGEKESTVSHACCDLLISLFPFGTGGFWTCDD